MIVAGGSGSRMKTSIPKQFLELKGLPILMHTINAFYNFFNKISIIVVLPSEYIATWEELCKKHNFKINHQIALGGKARFDSVKSGLKLIENECIIGVHDAVRPFVSKELIKSIFESAEINGNAIPSIPINDSVRQIENNLSVTINRDQLRIIQTPQCFKSEILKSAYEQNFNETFTDDASVVEAYGEKINLLEGIRENIKITTAYDMIIAEALIKL
ncbi:MAG: 2-C-methyl-D-erythritol 4-phosphate cytidylyltransferase [Bacteroidetes bacterium]|nr:2-C-methyl-D-erythritol 4-phosphate cytidylyltransferase [Bacteroidota bacterium]